MHSAIALLSGTAYRYGDPPPAAESASHVGLYVALLVAGWVLSLLIAFWLIRAGVRGGVRELVEQNRQQVALLQNQSALLSQLVKPLGGGAGAAPSASARAPAPAQGTEKAAPAVRTTGAGTGEDAASAWDDLRRR